MLCMWGTFKPKPALFCCSSFLARWPPTVALLLPTAALQDAEAAECHAAARGEELRALEQRLGGIQQRLDADAQRLKKAMTAVEQEREELKASAVLF